MNRYAKMAVDYVYPEYKPRLVYTILTPDNRVIRSTGG